MTAQPVRTRFAPSPTGALHAGNARTALFNALLARGAGGVFVLRIEDSDAGRVLPGAEEAILGDLRWLGLEWQEGPDAGGAYGPYRQSERGAVYAEQYERLERGGRVYPCFCTAQELERARSAQRRAGRAPRYPGTCAGLDPAQARARIEAGERPALRFRVPANGTVAFEDLVRGAQSFATEAIGDFVVRRADGTPAFFFCNAVDDALMGITHVLRGEDHLSNTPRQLLVLAALGLKAPSYGHLPLLVDADGRPLSKRRGATALGALRDAGYLPEALLNYLARLGCTHAEETPLEFDALARGFRAAAIGRSPARFEEAQLRHWQREVSARRPAAAIWGWWCDAAPELGALVPGPQALEFVAAVRGNVELPGEALHWARRLFGDPPEPDAEAAAAITEAGAGFFGAALEVLGDGATDLDAFRAALARVTGRRGRTLFLPLRAALTGTGHGPELARVWTLLGVGRIRRRLQAAALRAR